MLAERFGSGDGEREAQMTRQMPFEPLPASVLFTLGWSWMTGVMMWLNREHRKLAANLWQSFSAPLGLRLTAQCESKRNPRVSEWLGEWQPDTRQ